MKHALHLRLGENRILWLDPADLGEASGELALYLSLSASDPILARGESK
jgi:hypothetical protein